MQIGFVIEVRKNNNHAVCARAYVCVYVRMWEIVIVLCNGLQGRENKELPETLFACVAVNKPQEDQAEFIFDE